MSLHTRFACAVLITAAGLPAPAFAGFGAPNSWSRNDSYSTYQAWQTFSSATATNLPDAGEFPDGTTLPHPPRATVQNNAAAALLTSGGNIYSPTAALDIRVAVPDYAKGSGYVTTVMLQTKTLGEEIDYSTVKLTYNDGLIDQVLSPSAPRLELLRIPLGGFGGSEVESAFVFEVPSSAAQLNFAFQALGSSMSFDAITVDTITTRKDLSFPLLSGMNPAIGFVNTPVPEPIAASSLAIIGGLLTRRCRRTSRSHVGGRFGKLD